MHTQKNMATAGSAIATLVGAAVVMGIGLGGGIGIGNLISPKEKVHIPGHDQPSEATELAHVEPVQAPAAQIVPLTPEIKLAQPGDPMPVSMTTSDCLACHQVAIKVVGPSYQQVADKYQRQPNQVRKLARKVIQGGVGVWGQIPMTPHPQHTFEQAQEMVAWVLGQTTTEPAPASDDNAESAESSSPADL